MREPSGPLGMKTRDMLFCAWHSLPSSAVTVCPYLVVTDGSALWGACNIRC